MNVHHPLTLRRSLLVTQYSRRNHLAVLGQKLLDVRLLEGQRQVGQIQIGGILFLLLLCDTISTSVCIHLRFGEKKMSKSNLCKKRLWRSCRMGREKRRKIIISKVYDTFLCSHNDFLHFLVFCVRFRRQWEDFSLYLFLSVSGH
jgi:hypothetical protein